MTSGAMTKAEREAFLAEVHVGVLAIDEPGRGPLALPIWYLVDDGDVVLSMDRSSLKARLLEAAGRATLTVQTEAPPYRYVSVEGPVVLGPASHDSLELASRYLGAELGQWYVEQNPSNDATTTVRLTPEHWRTYDFSKVL
ncbi:MAG: pyridoxamine 5'-phosphate oxidase family protein [Acidimicrobiales bacterium]